MRKAILLGTAIAFGLTGTAWAGAKDKTSNTLVYRNAVGIINNVTVKTKIKSKGCKTQIQAKTVNMADGEIAICILEADVIGFGGNSLIVAGEAKAGKLKIKADLTEVGVLGNACGSIETISYNGQVKCYLDDLTYRLDSAGPGTWRDACPSGSLESGAPGTTMLKANPTVPVVIGICQSFTFGDRIGVPSTAEWALTGQRSAVIP